ncbi:hypothetical protein HHK36_005772 [Tetracentron sinense]|uniref:FRIGIDA-like protein n=1 Tax=Tetracentron sinense TaxID=13715 RepID=A0A835DMK0_TETSI|nr:hypothetical protein HHK36_005772 [Tetracentron sinense]
MISMKTISDAMKLVDVKKEDLRKAFEDLQAHSSSLPSFNLQRKDLEEHFDSIQKSLEERFKELESKESQSVNGSVAQLQSLPEPEPEKELESKESQSVDGSVAQLQSLPEKEKEQLTGKQWVLVNVAVKEIGESVVSPRPELKSLCVKMDGKALRSYINDHPKEFKVIRDEVSVAFLSASDPGKLVLDAMQGFYRPNSRRGKDWKLDAIRRTCLLLLEQLMKVSTQIKPQVRENAKKLAVEWKGKLTTDGESPLEALAFLQLLATYGLVSVFNADELIDIIVSVTGRRQYLPHLCRVLDLTDKMPDLIQKLISKGKHLDAVLFIYAFELADKFPPVPLLKAHVKDSEKVTQEILKKGNNSLQSQNKATDKEVFALRVVIKYIRDHTLESQYPPENLEKRAEQLEKQKADRKRPARVRAPKPQQLQQQQQQQSGNKRPRPAAPKTHAGATSTVPPSQHAHLQSAGLLSNQVAPYLSSTAGPYGLAGSTPTASYMNSSAGHYGLTGTPMGFAGNLNPTRSHPYSSESPMIPSFYDRPATYGGYGLLPLYRPSFYP